MLARIFRQIQNIWWLFSQENEKLTCYHSTNYWIKLSDQTTVSLSIVYIGFVHFIQTVSFGRGYSCLFVLFTFLFFFFWSILGTTTRYKSTLTPVCVMTTISATSSSSEESREWLFITGNFLTVSCWLVWNNYIELFYGYQCRFYGLSLSRCQTSTLLWSRGVLALKYAAVEVSIKTVKNLH